MVCGSCTREFQFCAAHLNGECVLPDAIVSGPQQQYVHLEDDQEVKQPQPEGIFDDDLEAPQGSSGPVRALGTPGAGVYGKDKTGRMRSAPYDTTQRRRTAAPTTPGALPGDTMLAELVNDFH